MHLLYINFTNIFFKYILLEQKLNSLNLPRFLNWYLQCRRFLLQKIQNQNQNILISFHTEWVANVSALFYGEQGQFRENVQVSECVLICWEMHCAFSGLQHCGAERPGASRCVIGASLVHTSISYVCDQVVLNNGDRHVQVGPIHFIRAFWIHKRNLPKKELENSSFISPMLYIHWFVGYLCTWFVWMVMRLVSQWCVTDLSTRTRIDAQTNQQQRKRVFSEQFRCFALFGSFLRPLPIWPW